MLTVIGAGAIGMLLSTYLTEAGFEVQLVVRREEQAKQLNLHGVTLVKETGDFHYPISATTVLDQKSTNHLYIIAVKSYDLHKMDSLLSKIDHRSPLLFIQNGLAHLEYAKNLPHHHIAFGSVEHGARKVDEHTVRHTGIGALKLAVLRGQELYFKKLLQAESEEFPVQMEEDAERVLLRKAILNSLINPLTAILQVKNGELLETESLEILKKVYIEIMTVFPEMAVIVPFEDVITLCKKTATNHSSMLADRMAGRKTEIDAISGALLKMAEERKADLPSLRVLHSLVKALEKGGSANE